MSLGESNCSPPKLCDVSAPYFFSFLLYGFLAKKHLWVVMIIYCCDTSSDKIPAWLDSEGYFCLASKTFPLLTWQLLLFSGCFNAVVMLKDLSNYNNCNIFVLLGY